MNSDQVKKAHVLLREVEDCDKIIKQLGTDRIDSVTVVAEGLYDTPSQRNSYITLSLDTALHVMESVRALAIAELTALGVVVE